MNKTYNIAYGPWDKPSVESVDRRPVLRVQYGQDGTPDKYVVHWQCRMKEPGSKVYYHEGSYYPVFAYEGTAYVNAMMQFYHRCRVVAERGPMSLAELESFHGEGKS